MKLEENVENKIKDYCSEYYEIHNSNDKANIYRNILRSKEKYNLDQRDIKLYQTYIEKNNIDNECLNIMVKLLCDLIEFNNCLNNDFHIRNTISENMNEIIEYIYNSDFFQDYAINKFEFMTFSSLNVCLDLYELENKTKFESIRKAIEFLINVEKLQKLNKQKTLMLKKKIGILLFNRPISEENYNLIKDQVNSVFKTNETRNACMSLIHESLNDRIADILPENIINALNGKNYTL